MELRGPCAARGSASGGDADAVEPIVSIGRRPLTSDTINLKARKSPRPSDSVTGLNFSTCRKTSRLTAPIRGTVLAAQTRPLIDTWSQHELWCEGTKCFNDSVSITARIQPFPNPNRDHGRSCLLAAISEFFVRIGHRERVVCSLARGQLKPSPGCPSGST